MSPPDLETPEESSTEVRSPGAEALRAGGLAGTPEAACTGRQAESEHLPGLWSQGPHSVLGFISRNHQVLTRERKEKKRKETT